MTTIDTPDWLSAIQDYDRMTLETRPAMVGDGLVIELAYKRTGITVTRNLVAMPSAEELVAEKRAVCEEMVARLSACRYLAPGEGQFSRLFRCLVANQLIGIISQHGLCFFYSEKHNRVARLVYEGSVSLIDEKSGNKIELRKNGAWAGFGHGATLRNLVEMMRDYVMRGRRMDPVFIGMERPNNKGNVWGYPDDQLKLCRAAALKLAILAPMRPERAERAA